MNLVFESRTTDPKLVVHRPDSRIVVDKEKVLQGYEDVATVYTQERSPDEAEREALTSVLENLSAGSRVLDAGCGGGNPILRSLTDHTRQAIGLDFSVKQLELATENAPDATLLRGDLTQIPLTENAFDAVLAFHSVIHIPAEEHQSVYDEFARILRPERHLLVSESPGKWEGTNPDWLNTGAEMQWNIAGAETTRSQLETAGFRIRNEYRTQNSMADDEEAKWIFFETILDR